MDTLKWNGGLIKLLHIQLWCTHESRKIYTFCVNVYDSSHVSGSTNQTFGKTGWWNQYATQTGNYNKKFSIKYMCSILSMCCTKRNCTSWRKVVKHVLSITNILLGYLNWNIVPSTQKMFFSHDVVFDKKKLRHQTRHIYIHLYLQWNQRYRSFHTLHLPMNKLVKL